MTFGFGVIASASSRMRLKFAFTSSLLTFANSGRIIGDVHVHRMITMPGLELGVEIE